MSENRKVYAVKCHSFTKNEQFSSIEALYATRELAKENMPRDTLTDFYEIIEIEVIE